MRSPSWCASGGAAGGIAFDGDADRCLAVDSRGRTVNGDAIMAVLAIDRHRRGELPAETGWSSPR